MLRHIFNRVVYQHAQSRGYGFAILTDWNGDIFARCWTCSARLNLDQIQVKEYVQCRTCGIAFKAAEVSRELRRNTGIDGKEWNPVIEQLLQHNPNLLIRETAYVHFYRIWYTFGPVYDKAQTRSHCLTSNH